MEKGMDTIEVRGARQHNLKGIDVDIPLGKFVVVTGVSGSGKSSLAFDVLAKEGQRRFLETLPAFSRQFAGRVTRPEVDSIKGLPPVIVVDQRKSSSVQERSTVGTLSDLWDYLRLLFSRLGTSESVERLTRSHFSFNSPTGACPACNGIGKEEVIDLDVLITDPSKSLREGVLATTLPTGYVMYSQVTLEVLNQVCEAHGFTIDQSWNTLTEEQQQVIWRGSERLKVPFGKHSLESRLKWTGITAKPREEGYYKGMLNIMEDILKRDRNKNILKYVKAKTCSSCHGGRLNQDALGVRLNGVNIHELGELELTALQAWFDRQTWKEADRDVAAAIWKTMHLRLSWLIRLGLGHLTLNRSASSLSGGEVQRIRLINQVCSGLSDLLYVFDEPSIGLDKTHRKVMVELFDHLIREGNSVVVVEHDLNVIRAADWIVELGPKAGVHGGELLFNGSMQSFLKQESLESPTQQALRSNYGIQQQSEVFDPLLVKNCTRNNLKHIDVELKQGALNVITGTSGAGKSSLMFELQERLLEAEEDVVFVDQKPIGRTPRSNPATYTKLADKIRDVFAKQEEAQRRGLKKTAFSFNTKGGRCETCQGAGVLQVGMHFLGNISTLCPTCEGKRFNDEVLAVTYKQKNISEILEMSVEEACTFWEEEPKIQVALKALMQVGLGYVKLGQPSPTLSGGEAQRLKLASALQQKAKKKTFYLLDEPTVGLHANDVQVLLDALGLLLQQGHTIISIEHHDAFIARASCCMQLGPGGGTQGGEIIPPTTETSAIQRQNSQVKEKNEIHLKGVQTHTLKNIDVVFPKHELTVVVGVSGSGKSSLVFDTLAEEAQRQFSESMSPYTRSLFRFGHRAKVEEVTGLGPVVALSRGFISNNKRSTVGTLSGIYDACRLLYARWNANNYFGLTAGHFSFNHELGACPRCEGVGAYYRCSEELLVTDPSKSLEDGAFAGTRIGKYYADPYGRFMALLRCAADELNVSLEGPWNQLNSEAKDLVLLGAGDRVWSTQWEFQTKTRKGSQAISGTWDGFLKLIDAEYELKQTNKDTSRWLEVMELTSCEVCDGGRLRKDMLDLEVNGITIQELTAKTVEESIVFFQEKVVGDEQQREIFAEIKQEVMPKLETLKKLGLGYLQLDRMSQSLSGGEGQRVRLSGALSGDLAQVTYVLDEPSLGLHASQVQVLIGVLQELVSRGNTVIAVEHDEAFIRQADYVVELGPGAGNQGGRVTVAGQASEVLSVSQFLTGKTFNTNSALALKRRAGLSFGVHGAHKHNLKQLDVHFQAGALTAVTGISGSGKTTLVRDVLYTSHSRKRAVGCKEVFGLDQFDEVHYLEQNRNSGGKGSTVATRIGLMDGLRTLYAKSDDTKVMGLKKKHFSYLDKEGRCSVCQGRGVSVTVLDFVQDVEQVCPACDGTRFGPEVRSCKYSGKSIADVLALSVEQALVHFTAEPAVTPYLEALKRCGLGYLSLGQSTGTLSGGEVQRLALSERFVTKEKGVHLYLLDEPSAGLHAQDIQNLLQVFDELLKEGHTLVIVEHHAALIQAAHQQITLGPGAGQSGGNLCE